MQHLSHEELCNQYTNWWSSMDQPTHNLLTQILTYEAEYFNDMLLKTPETSKYLEVLDNNGEQWNLFYDFNLSLDAQKYTFHIKKLEDCAGIHDSSNNSITIDPAYLENKEVILHEMVHAYENILDTCVFSFVKEVVFLELYKYLQQQNIEVDKRILAHTNMLSGIDITQRGGRHGVFFFLKTLELDIKCNLPLGTICGYDRENY